MRTKKARPKKYDPDMIRDFVEHLKWELRNYHFEYTTPTVGAFAKEPAEMLAKYIKRRDQFQLIATTALQRNEELTDEQREEYIARFRAERAEMTQRYLDALESLQPLIEEATACIRHWQKTRHELMLAYNPLAYFKDN